MGKTKNKCIFLLFCSFLSIQLFSKICPKDSSVLNYTQVLFEYEQVTGAHQYKLELSEITKNPDIKEYYSFSTVKIVNGLSFGKYYKWRVLALNEAGKQLKTSLYFHFKIMGVDLVNKDKYRLKLNYMDTSINKNDLLFVDYNRIAINRNGDPVWYLPDIKNKVDFKERIRDLKITKDGSFTFLNNKSAIECDITGNILWEAPGIVAKDDSLGFYHHCFTKLENGNYMLLGTKYMYRPIPASFPKDKIKQLENTKIINGVLSTRIEFGTILEYNSRSELVWSWNSDEYISDEEIFNHPTADTLPTLGPHMNSFDVNPEKNIVSVGFRDLSKILVIDKSTGKIICTYGGQDTSSTNQQSVPLFKFQHDCRFLKDGRIAILNNNDVLKNKNAVSSLVILPEPGKTADVNKAEWSFSCNFDTLTNGQSLKGGCVNELENGNLLVCMGHLNRIFEITPSKKIVWDGFYEKYSPAKKEWVPYPQYRVSPAESLYPNYFSVQISEKKKKKKTVSLAVRIFNEGSGEDSYWLTISDKAGNILEKVKTAQVKGGDFTVIKVNLEPDKTSNNKKLYIEVNSKTNELNNKKIVLD